MRKFRVNAFTSNGVRQPTKCIFINYIHHYLVVLVVVDALDIIILYDDYCLVLDRTKLG